MDKCTVCGKQPVFSPKGSACRECLEVTLTLLGRMNQADRVGLMRTLLEREKHVRMDKLTMSDEDVERLTEMVRRD